MIDYPMPYNGIMTAFDYRRASNFRRILTNEEKEVVDKDLDLIRSKDIFIKRVYSNIYVPCHHHHHSNFNEINNLLYFIFLGIYSYEYMDLFDRFEECEIPLIEKLVSKLKAGKGINKYENEHAKRFSIIFKRKHYRITITSTYCKMCSYWMMFWQHFVIFA